MNIFLDTFSEFSNDFILYFNDVISVLNFYFTIYIIIVTFLGSKVVHHITIILFHALVKKASSVLILL